MRRFALRFAVLCAFFSILGSCPTESGAFDGRLKDVRRIVATVPAQWRPKQVLTFHSVLPKEMEAVCRSIGFPYREKDSYLIGIYFADSRDSSVFYVDETLDSKLFTLTVLHETAHHIWKHRLNLVDRFEWLILWGMDDKRPSWYAASNVEDGFCEAFAHWRTKSGSQDRAESRWLFRLENDLKKRG